MKNSRSLLTVAVAAAALTAATTTVAVAQPKQTARPAQTGSAQARTHSIPVSSGEFATARAQIAAQIAARKPAAVSRIAHLDPSLNQVAGVPGASAESTVPVSAKGTVDVRVAGTGATAAAVAAGGRVIARFGGRITVAIRPAKLRALATSAGVTAVAQAVLAQPQAQLTSEGVLASGAQNWAQHGNLGNGGAGVKVAIVDAGFGNLQSEIADGNFDDPDGNPITVVYDNTITDPDPNATDHCSDDSATDHGTGVAEIVHQMAPRATLYLYCVDDDQGFSQSASQVVTAGIKIATSSLGFIADSRGDGAGAAGSTEAAVKTAHDAGVFWIQSAGNSAQDHWSGKLVDANSDGDIDLLNTTDQGEGDIVDLDPHTSSQPAASGSVVLSWDQWPTSNLNVILGVQEFDSKGNPVGQAQLAEHTDGDDPTLSLPIVNLSSVGGDFHQYLIYIVADPTVNTSNIRYDLTYSGDVYASYLSSVNPARAAAGSVTEPATSPAAVTVGAANWRTDVLEQFSSRGPTIDNRVKPDLLAFDGVSSNLTDLEASDGTNVGFYGTSAAAPHVAGAAALALANNAQLNTPASLLTFLQGRTSPHVSPATNAGGSGVLQLLDLANPATPTCPARTTVPAKIVIDRPSITFTSPITTTCTNYHVIAALQGTGGVFDTLNWTATATSSVAHFNPRVNAPGAYSTKLVNGVSDVGGVAWTSATTTLKYSTQDFTASSRQGSAVYINGRLKNYSNTATGLVPGGNRVLYLQRYLNGAWQTMLSRTTLANGTMTVGFIQNTVYQYRLVTQESATIWGGNSGSTFR